MELQKAQDLQALEKSSAQVALAAVKENNIKLQKENQVNKRGQLSRRFLPPQYWESYIQ